MYAIRIYDSVEEKNLWLSCPLHLLPSPIKGNNYPCAYLFLFNFIPKQYIETLCKWNACVWILAVFQLDIIFLSLIYVSLYSIPVYGGASIYLSILLFMDIGAIIWLLNTYYHE